MKGPKRDFTGMRGANYSGKGELGLINQKKTFISWADQNSDRFANPRWDSRIGGTGPYCLHTKRMEGDVHYVCGGSALARPPRRVWYGKYAAENCVGRTS